MIVQRECNKCKRFTAQINGRCPHCWHRNVLSDTWRPIGYCLVVAAVTAVVLKVAL